MRRVKLFAVVEQADNNYSAYIENLEGVYATGKTLTKVKENLLEAIDVFIETCESKGYELPAELQGSFEVDFRMDVRSLLNVYSGIFTKAGLERLTGINQKQLWHYANGKSLPRRAQVLKIENALHQLGNELISIHL
ncbi:MAG: type II toxin-antitoxin system HicB family antitoxin [Bacteroidales bacterium]|nr:type II toxin-antitoxin system HicB family antitoxin [Bacteroidales bacterium]